MTSIGEAAFYYCTGLTSVTISSGVTSIGKEAFYKCTGLTSITIPNTVTSIGWGAFGACSGLTSLTIPDSVTTLGEISFSQCTNLQSVSIPAGVTGSFSAAMKTSCNNITSVTIRGTGSGKIVATDTFGFIKGTKSSKTNYYFQSLTSVVIDENVTSIQASAFKKCTNTRVTILSKNTSVDSGAFVPSSDTTYGCSGVTIYGYAGSTAQTFANNNSEISFEAIPFEVDANGVLTKYAGSGGAVTIPETFLGRTITSIGDSAFKECTGLTSVNIPSGVTSIGEYAFYKCTSLTNVTIPNSVTSIGDSAFKNCSKLTSVTIPTGVTTIGKYAFQYCNVLASVTIPAGVTSIGNSAFNYCRALKNITLPSSVTSIGSGAFAQTGLTSVSIPSGVTSIGDYAFMDCENLTELTIGNSSVTITDNAFTNCSKLEVVWIPCNATASISLHNAAGDTLRNQDHDWSDWNSVTSQRTCSACKTTQTCSHNWGTGWNSTTSQRKCGTCDKVETCSHASWNAWNTSGTTSQRTCSTCGKVETCSHKWGKLNDGVSRCETCQLMCPIDVVGTQLTKYTGTATVLVLPSGITSIGNYAFKECNGLTSVTIPEGVTSIGNYAFYKCTKLSSVTIPSGVMSIGIGTFDSCSALESVSIPSGVTSIGDDAFASCTNLSSVSIPSSVKSIGNYAFSSCTKLSSVSIPSSVKSIGMGAFFNTSLSSVSIPSSVTSIGNYAFSSCRNLSSVELPCNASDTLKSALVSQAGDENKVKVNDHTWGNWDSTTSKRTCKTCNKVETCTEHTWGNWSNSQRTCSTCGKEETCSHTWGDWENPDKNDSRRHTCSTCGKEEYCGHNTPEHNDYWSKTSEGHTCTNCGLIGEHVFLELPEPNKFECGICQWTGMCTHNTWDAETKCTRCKVQGYTVTVNSENNDTALQGGGIYAKNTKATVIAPAKAGFTFNGWYKGETQVCKTLEYSFWVTELTSLTTTLTAKYTSNQKFAVEIIGENGAQFTVNDSTTVQTTLTSDYAFGDKLVLKAKDADKVSAWLNGSNKKLGSMQTLEVTVTGAMTIKLMYKASIDGQAMVEYVSDYGQILSCKSYSATDDITVPTGPSKTGYRFDKWSLSVKEIKEKITAGETHIVVTPVYQEIETTYTVTVKYLDGAVETFENIREGTAKTITAKDIEDKTFAYWRDEYNKILSYSKSYYLVVTENVTLTAVYKTVISEDEPQAKPVIHMEKSKAFEDAGKNKVAFTTSYDVPEGYTLNEVGIIYSTRATTDSTLVVGGSGVVKCTSSLTTQQGTYKYNLNVGSYTSTEIYARGYMVVTDNATGNAETMYAEIAWGSYDSLRGSTNG